MIQHSFTLYVLDIPHMMYHELTQSCGTVIIVSRSVEMDPVVEQKLRQSIDVLLKMTFHRLREVCTGKIKYVRPRF